MGTVAEVLKKTNYTQIARLSGTTPAYISLLFNGRRNGKTVTLKKVATALGMSLDDLHGHLASLPHEKRSWPKKPSTSAPAARGRRKTKGG
jgi:transcriptional regulator with XRE-family HTH domain